MAVNRYTFTLLSFSLVLTLALYGSVVKLIEIWRHESNYCPFKIAGLVVSFIFCAQWFLTFSTLAILPISKRHTLKTAIFEFYALFLLLVIGSYRWRIIENSTKAPKRRQEELLLRLLSTNAETEYGRKMNFKGVKNREDFRRMHPLTKYSNYQPYIDRLAEGENGLLTKDPVERFNLSSGTTGKCKLLPAPTGAHKHVQWHLYLPITYRLRFVDKSWFVAPLKAVFFIFIPRWRYTEKTGILIGPASAFSEKRKSSLWTSLFTTPRDAEVALSESGQCYLHWLFVLTDSEVVRFDGVFAGGLITSIDLLQNNWKQLVDDIRHGRISKMFDIPEDLIAKLYSNGFIWPDPRRAQQIEDECSKGFHGIIQRLFPRVTSCYCTATGAHSVHREKLQWLLGDKVRIASMVIYASEAMMGMNMDDPSGDEILYTMLPDATFMEFIPEDEVNEAQPNTLFLDQLQIGKRYEVVVTSIYGFYRYRMGDIVGVKRFRHGVTPVVKFCGRVGTWLDLVGEKTTDDMVFAALKATVPKWKGCEGLVDYTTSESATCAKVFGKMEQNWLYYVVFVELDNVSRELTPSEVDEFDLQLAEITFPYKSFRSKQTLRKPKIFVVAKGTFELLKQMVLVRNSAVSNQYKTPGYVANEDSLKLLMSHALPSEQAAIALL